MVTPVRIAQNDVVEITLGPLSAAVDPPARVDVMFVDPSARERLVPAFLSHGEWRVRYASAMVGRHQYHAHADQPLPVPAGDLEVCARQEPHPLGSHGPLRVAADNRHLEHSDGTAFLWLADTWWDGFTRRLPMDEFRRLAAQRAEQGFSVVQIVAGLYPEMAPFALEGESDSGWAWHSDFAGPNLAWFDEADQRVTELVRHGLVPCIVGAWGYYLQYMDVEQMLRHWRELIARWGAYPVVWCLAGEMPGVAPDQMRAAADMLGSDRLSASQLIGLLSRKVLSSLRRTRHSDHRGFPNSAAITDLLGLKGVAADQVKKWNDVARGVRALEPFSRPVTVHSMPNWPPYELVEDTEVIDFWLLQTGHSATYSLAPSVNQVIDALAQTRRSR